MAIGSLALISFNEFGASSSVSTSSDIVKEKIKFFLSTNKGEITTNLTYGADLQHFVMRPLDRKLVTDLMMVLRSELASEMPYVSVQKVDALSNPGEGRLTFTLYYSVSGIEDNVIIEVQ